MDLVALLYEPADFEASAAEPSSSAAATSCAAPSVLDALHGLNQQCSVFKKSAEQLGQSLVTLALSRDESLT